MSDPDSTDFGFQRVPRAEKARRVGRVFDSVASRYDLMNDLMSAGLHRLWKRVALTMAAVRPGQRVLDLAGGTGDLTAGLAARVGPRGRVVLADINAAMLGVGRDRLLDAGLAANVAWVQADAERLPFPDDCFDRVTIAFGLRNVTDKTLALAAMYRVLKPGGRLLVLEFSQPTNPVLARLYDQYSFQVLPRLGRLVAGDADSYRYLAESIRLHPDQERLREMLAAAGFAACHYHNLTGGIVALHLGDKPWR
ncbi:MAG: bifunctional demethylmenaquinone methyltransferase/2-methoxy-6-polyprenyl-1,4-benzoquinol methylase UbiE [Pseudomonadota bacterium]|jgi:demethylmenaquinone methyltransferase / 2-methoxy-6-polyprenyl-1,4-benzoquinol methylase